MKLNISQIIMLLNALTTANLSKTTAEDKNALIKLSVALRKEGKAWNDFLEEARKRCRPEDFDAIEEKYARLKELPEEERKAVEEAVSKFDAEVDEVVRPEFEAEREIDAPYIDDETLARLADSNPGWKMGDILTLRDLLTEPKAEGK